MPAVPVLHRVRTLDLTFTDWQWPFAAEHRARIDAHFAGEQRKIPDIFNGGVLLGRHLRFVGDVLHADYFETDFASFLAWRDWGYPDAGVFNGFGAGAIRGSDGAFVLGEMAANTSNAGKIYFAAGTPDRNDLRGKVVDIADSVRRETQEETGLSDADYRAADAWDVVVTDGLVAMIRILDIDRPGLAVQAQIESCLATQTHRELSAIHLVRSMADVDDRIPLYAQAFLAAHL
jgi:8-oxo-dGTP pyrophosphatase MutT (NUDIX family)